MKLHDVLKHGDVLAGDVWIRPVTWRKTGAAFAVKEGGMRSASIYRVPSGKPDMGITPYVSELSGDWEIVTPADVLDGK